MRSSMRDRDLAPVAAVAAIVCCGGSALAIGIVGGVALAAVGQFAAVTIVGLGLVVLIARRLDRRRHDRAPSALSDTADHDGPSAVADSPELTERPATSTAMNAVWPVDEDQESPR